MNISPEAFKYLYIQRGEVAAAYEQGFDAWKKAYEDSLDAIVASIMPVMPPVGLCLDVLDIGGGLGGIAVKMREHWNLNYENIDGMMDEPEVVLHRQTFSNHVVARNFLQDNKLYSTTFHSTAVGSDELGQFDVIMSFAAWCFHIEPMVYLHRVEQAMKPNTVVILDVRKDKLTWHSQLADTLGRPKVLDEGRKFVRLAWN